jgi:hypothetical protein
MTTVKTYGWLGPERLKFINDNPKVVSLLYDLGLLPEEISARVRGYVEDELKPCHELIRNLAKERHHTLDHSATTFEVCNKALCKRAKELTSEGSKHE